MINLRSNQAGHEASPSPVSGSASGDHSHPVRCSSRCYSSPFSTAVFAHLQESEIMAVEDFVIPFTFLPNLQRVALGIRDAAVAIHIRLYRGRCTQCRRPFGCEWSKAPVCVHLLSGAGQINRYYHDCTSERPWESRGLDCNFLVFMLERGIQKLLNHSSCCWWRMPYHTKHAKLVELVTSTSKSSTSDCVNPNCHKRLRRQVARPAPCSHRCRMAWESVPLAVRLSPLIRDPSVLDLLCTLAMAELDRTYPGPQLSPGPFPLDPALMRAALDSLPPMERGVTVSQLLGSGPGRSEPERVLTWIGALFEGVLVPTPPSAAISQMSAPVIGHDSFLLLNTHEARHARFQAQLRHAGLERGGGVATFHGTPPHNLLSILCDGLNSDPVYYSSEPSFSCWFISYRAQYEPDNPQLCRGWRNSRYKDVGILLGVEVAGSPPDPRWDEAIAPAHAVMVRYLFIVPRVWVYGLEYRNRTNSIRLWLMSTGLRGGQIMEQMRRGYQRIHDGTLVSEIEGKIRARHQGYLYSGFCRRLWSAKRKYEEILFFT